MTTSLAIATPRQSGAPIAHPVNFPSSSSLPLIQAQEQLSSTTASQLPLLAAVNQAATSNRLPRGYHSCIRCKKRKQRCEPCPSSEIPLDGPVVEKRGPQTEEGGDAPDLPCLNCINAKMGECVYQVRLERGKRGKDDSGDRDETNSSRGKKKKTKTGTSRSSSEMGRIEGHHQKIQGLTTLPRLNDLRFGLSATGFQQTGDIMTGGEGGGAGVFYDLSASGLASASSYGANNIYTGPSNTAPWLANGPHNAIPCSAHSASAYPSLPALQARQPYRQSITSNESPSSLSVNDIGALGRQADDDISSSEASSSDADEAEASGKESSRGRGADAARGVAFLSLNAHGSPVYVGPSSGFSWARLVMAGVAASDRPIQARSPNTASRQHHMTSKEFQRSQFSAAEELPFVPVALSNDALRDVPQEVAEIVFRSVYRHIQPRYGFPDWLMLHEFWQNRDDIMRQASEPKPSRNVATGAFFIWILFAIGSRLVQRQNLPSLTTPEAYYAKAMTHLETIVGLHDLRNVQALMFMIMYAFREPKAPSVWFLTGVTMRLCLSLGLHRELRGLRASRVSNYQIQLRRRLFWCAYSLDRMLALSLGRPLGIDDRDIDTSLPFDVDCVSTDPKAEDVVPGRVTSMTSALHLFALKRIDSEIQREVYRVDRGTSVDISPDPILAKLDDWERRIPDVADDPNCAQLPCVTRDVFLSRSTDSRHYVLRPLTVSKNADPEHVKLLAKTAAESCIIHKRLHQSPTSVISLEALRSCFLSGLTLLHAVRVKRDAIPVSTLQKAIRSTSNTMFAYAQHFRAAQAFHEAFEDLAQAVLEYIESPPSPPPASTANEVRPVDPLSQLVAETTTASQVDVWQSLQAEIPGMMNAGSQDTFLSMLESLGVPLDGLWIDNEPNALGAWDMGSVGLGHAGEALGEGVDNSGNDLFKLDL